MATAKTVTIIYVGPPHSESPVFGPLEPGERYQSPAELADYLCRQHPDFWQRPAVKTPTPAPEAHDGR